jgi:hypothetical protein
MIRLKRTLDERAHISAPLFDRDFLTVYNDLLDRCFTTFAGWGEDAKLRTLTDRRKMALGDRWKPEWDECFVARSEAPAPSEIRTAYTSLMTYLAAAMGATEADAHILGSGRLPANYDTQLVRVVSRTPQDKEISTFSGDPPAP